MASDLPKKERPTADSNSSLPSHSNYFSELDPLVTLLILKKWVKSTKTWAVARLTSKLWLPPLFIDSQCETLTIRAVEGHKNCPHKTMQILQNMAAYLQKYSFSHLHTLRMAHFAAPERVRNRASKPWLQWWRAASDPRSGFRSVQRLVLEDSWPFVDPTSTHLSASFPGLTSLELSHESDHVCELPQDLGRLGLLRELRIHCRFLETIPEPLWSAPSLQRLDMDFCYSGSANALQLLSRGLRRLPCLRRLALLRSRSGELAEAFYGAVGLECLRVRECHSVLLSRSLTSLTNLTKLSFDFPRQAPGEVPWWRMPSLRVLDLKFPGTFLQDVFGGMTNVRRLRVEGTLFASRESFARLTAMEKLHLFHVAHPSVLLSVAPLASLTSLALSASDLSRAPPEFGTFPRLRELSLVSCTLGEVPGFALRLARLTFLSLRGSEISHVSPEGARSLAHLKCLDISGAPTFVFPEALTKLTSLTALAFTVREWVGMEAIVGLPGLEKMRSLEVLSMEYLRREDVPKSLARLSRLRLLSLRGSCHVSRLPKWMLQLEALEELDICGTRVEELPLDFLDRLSRLTALGCESRLLEKNDDRVFRGMASLDRVYQDESSISKTFQW